jgi:hypothetical protein
LSEFEFFTVAISIILALGIGRLLDGLAPALSIGPRYWIHVGWIVQKLLNHALWWWGVWAARNFEWNLAWFLWSLLGPAVLYLQAAALVTSTPSLVTSWKDRFFQIRPWFFAGNLALCALLLFQRDFNPEQSVLDPTGTGLLLLAVIAIIGIMSKNPGVQAVLVICALTVQILGLGAAMFQTDML